MDQRDARATTVATDIDKVFQRSNLIDLDLGRRLFGLAASAFAFLVVVLFVERQHANVGVITAGEQLARRTLSAGRRGITFAAAFTQKPGRKLLGEMHLADTGRASEQQTVRERVDALQQALPDWNVPIMYFINRYLQFLSQVVC